MKIKRYNSTSLTNFKKALIQDREKGGFYQKTLLEKAKDYENHKFVEWLDEQIVHHSDDNAAPPIEGDTSVALPDLPPQISASEFISPPSSTIENWFSTWGNLQISDAANSSVWAYITRQMIAEGKLRPYDLMLDAADAKGKGDEFAGQNNIKKALDTSGQERKTNMDKCVRNFLRHLCGLYEERGAKSLYQDCPFARAWWQCHIAESIKTSDKEDIISLFRKKTLWTNLSDKITTRLTVLGDTNIRNGIIMFLIKKSNYAYHKDKSLKNLLTSVGIMTTWCALGYFPPEEVEIHIDRLATSIKEKPLGESIDPEDNSSEESE